MHTCKYTVICLFILSSPCFAAKESQCFGTTDKGYLENGWQLPAYGKNFSAYSLIGVAAGRNFVHSKVHKIVVDAYRTLETSSSETVFVYGESGWENGGKFYPHKTHQNGLSIDFFVPVLDESGKSVALPANVLNRFGYGIEFKGKGVYKNLRIDYDAMAKHLLALKAAADQHNAGISRVIFDNTLQQELLARPQGQALKNQIKFSVKKPWIRHDEHYHVDFIVPCKQPK